MITFNMSIRDDFAHFSDTVFDIHVFVDKTKNKFSVRIGSYSSSIPTGDIFPVSEKDLNDQLNKMYKKYLNDKI